MEVTKVGGEQSSGSIDSGGNDASTSSSQGGTKEDEVSDGSSLASFPGGATSGSTPEPAVKVAGLKPSTIEPAAAAPAAEVQKGHKDKDQASPTNQADEAANAGAGVLTMRCSQNEGKGQEMVRAKQANRSRGQRGSNSRFR